MFHVANLIIWAVVVVGLVTAELMSIDTPEHLLHTTLIIVNMWAATTIKR